MPAIPSAGRFRDRSSGLWRFTSAGVSFLVITVIGLVWLFFWLFLVTDTPATNKRVSEAEKQLVASSRAAAAVREGDAASIGSWLKTPAVLAVALAFFSYNYVLYFFLTWLPTYLMSVHHLDLKSIVC